MPIVLVLVGLAGVLGVAHLFVPTILRSERHALLSGHIMLISLNKRNTADLITFTVDYPVREMSYMSAAILRGGNICKAVRKYAC